jgi:hypothetical protein
MNAILFQPTGEVRPPKKDEWFLYDIGNVFECAHFDFTVEKYPIYTRHELSKEVAQRMMEEAK